MLTALDSGTPWWEGPPPPGWTGPWPPPLGPGDTYGATVGQINYAPGNGPPGGLAPGVSGGLSPGVSGNQGALAPGVSGNLGALNPGILPPGSAGPTGGPGGGLVNAYTDPFAAPTPTGYPGVPKFQAPSGEEALNDPGYQFRLQQGHDQLQNWAAARGTLNDSSTAKALEDYGQNSASQEYQQVFNRNWNAFQPQLLGYTTDTARIQHQNDLEWQHANDLWTQKYNQFRNRQLDTVNANTATG